MEHERMRFKTLNRQQLKTRLGKITKPSKLQNFIKACDEFGYRSLREEALDRYNQMMFLPSKTLVTREPDPIVEKPKLIKTKTQPISSLQQFRRSIEF